VSVVPGSEECRTCCLLYITLVNSLSLASSTSSSTVLWCCSQRPERMPRRMTACSRFRSSVVAKPHHELQLYSKDVRLYNPHIGIRELEFVCCERSHWQPSSAYVPRTGLNVYYRCRTCGFVVFNSCVTAADRLVQLFL